ncbi:MAG: tyrosine recombinase XerC [Clostridia bacterium]|nr:tyrosine recombinase XerC [Clostridia bacterium]
MKREILQNSPPVIRDFLTYNEAIKGKSTLSVNEYYCDLLIFFRYILMQRGMVPKDTPFEEIDISSVNIELIKTITTSDLYSFLVFCKNERDNNTATRARKTSTLRIFFKYLSANTHQIDQNPALMLEAPKVKQSLPKHLTLEDSIELLNSVEGNNAKRDFCILTLFLNCGLRLSELCSLNLNDIKSDNTMVVTGKGNKERLVYLNEACINAINDYLAVRPHDSLPITEKNALFISRNHRRISNKTVQHIVKTYLEKSGLGGMGYSTHKLRHTAATLMYQHGNVDIRVLQDILGHANLGTTQIYTHVSDKQIKHAVDANPLSNIKQKKQQ